MRTLLVANSNDADPGYIGQRFIENGYVGERLQEHGGRFEHCEREHPELWPSIDGADLILLLGSWWSAYWKDFDRQIRAECEMIVQATNRGIPIFGICYGSQIVAKALGGTAHKATKHEVGWCLVEAKDSCLPLGGRWMQWHYDTFTPPTSMEVLATSDAGPQAIRLGRTFATQFHPEVTPEIVSRWASDSGELEKIGMNARDLVEQTRAEVISSGPKAARLVDWFLESTAGRQLQNQS